MSKWNALFLLFLVWGCATRQLPDAPLQEAQAEKKTYFVRIPITKFSSIQSPCIDVKIGSAVLSMELDLGYRGEVTVVKPSIDLIKPKTFLQEYLMYGIQGKEYSVNLYHIPKVQIDTIIFNHLILQEEEPAMMQDTTFVPQGQEPAPKPPGRLGWELFRHTHLLLDVKQAEIAFCDSLETLESQGYSVNDFAQTPLFLERGFMEIQAETPEGLVRCMLDTGSTLNFFHVATEEGHTIEQMVWDPDNVFTYPSFKIGGKDFGPVTLHCVPIKLPIRIEAILGMEFFQENRVFFDFPGQYAYISPASVDANGTPR